MAMNIALVPQRRDDGLTVTKRGEVLIINGEEFDLGVIPAGATLPAGSIDCEWFVGDIDRAADGTLTLGLLVPYGPDGTEEQRFPKPLASPADGVLIQVEEVPAALRYQPDSAAGEV